MPILNTINPSTGEPIRSFLLFSPVETGRVMQRASEAYAAWSKYSFEERGAYFLTLAGLLRARANDFAHLMALEMGKPLQQGIAEIEKCASCCEHYATQTAEYLAPQHIATEASKSYVAMQPLGVVLAVMPWNFPFWQVIRFFAPAAMAGNTVVLKHAPNTFGCAEALERVIADAGFPSGVLQALFVDVPQVESLITHPAVQAVTFTGSSRAGALVAAQAGSALKRSVLELGGSDPYIVLEDADMEHAVKTCVTARLLNSGQSCIAAKRFIVVEAVRREFEECFVETMRSKTFGNPLHGDFDIGPIARADLRGVLHHQIMDSAAKGARLLLGGTMPSGAGWFYPPTVLTNVTRGMAAYHDELFGPVAAILAARDEREAVQLANDTLYGLGAAVFTRDTERGERIAREELHAGFCAVNDVVRSDPRLPFGGIKASGYGRELGAFGVREFVNVKTIIVR